MKYKRNQGRLMRLRHVLICLTVLAFTALTGCGQDRPACHQFIGPSRDLCLLKTHGVSVLREGQIVKIILPSDRLFVNDTAKLAPDFKPVLAVAGDFIRSFSTISVKVAAFTDAGPEGFKTKSGKSLSQELTSAQAREVERFLWCHDINARLLYSVGENGKGAIAWSGSPIGRYLNRRVEITFRYYRDNTAWY